MTFEVDINRIRHSLQATHEGVQWNYRVLDGIGTISLVPVRPGVYSGIDAGRSFTIYVAALGDQLEIWVDQTRYLVSISDPRDRASASLQAGANGPLELRTQMPGKVVKILVQAGDAVEAGQGLVVVEAMKMQNELKAPRAGAVARVHATEGSTVGANALLIVIE